MSKPQANPGMNCPLMNKDVSKVCHKCEWYILIRGKHPQSEQELDTWGCAIRWIPIIGIENSQMQRQTAAAVESFRNETVKRQDGVIEAITQQANKVDVYITKPVNDPINNIKLIEGNG